MKNSPLIFVYNADTGVFNLLTDMAHKALSPATYRCNLCALTHGTFRVRNEWKEYLQKLTRPVEFLHADEMRARFNSVDVDLPAVFEVEDGGLKLLISADEINLCHTIGDLKNLLLRQHVS